MQHIRIFTLIIGAFFYQFGIVDASKSSSEPTVKDGDEVISDTKTGKVKNRGIAEFLVDYLSIKYQNINVSEFLYVGCKRQLLYHIKDTSVIAVYKVSTAKNGVGNIAGSEKTPLGLHVVKTKIGESAPVGGIIKSGGYTGQVTEIVTEPVSLGTDDLTTRAIGLDGVEKGYNKGGSHDSFHRGIYIHGTPEEGLIGSPASHGCIRMKNTDVVELFSNIPIGTPVIILNN